MTGKRLALIIANYQYDDTGFQKLVAPAFDAEKLARVLENPEIAGFEVITLINEPADTTRKNIASLFAKKKRDDLLLLYFSGHGVLDVKGRLYLAVKDTNLDLLSGTAIEAAFITKEMNDSYSRSQVLILDCCNSGAFERGGKGVPKGASVHTCDVFEATGVGRFVMTATDSTQYAWEGDQVTGEAKNSVFTHYLIKGLEGEAANEEGLITFDSLYDYVHEHVVIETPKQTPCKWTYKGKGTLELARSLVVKRVTLPRELSDAIKNPIPKVREGAIAVLKEIMLNTNKGLALSAYDALNVLSGDDSRMVSKAAEEVLAKTPDWIIRPVPEPVELEKKISELSSEAQKLFGEKKYTEAIAKWEEVLKLDSENREAIKGKKECESILEKLNELIIAAQRLFNEGKYREAMDKWSEVLKLDTESKIANDEIKKAKNRLIIELNSEARRLTRIVEAIALWEEVIKLDPENKEAVEGIEKCNSILSTINLLNISSQRLSEEGKYQEAIDKWKEVQNLEPENQTAKDGIKKAKEKLVNIYCTICGSPNEREFIYCTHCGNKLNKRWKILNPKSQKGLF